MVTRFRRVIQPVWPLLAILALYIILVAVYSWVTPPFEGPDEPQHFAYIEWLVKNHDFPPQGAAAWATPVEQEASQPPFYYLLASVPARIVGVDNPSVIYRPNPYPILFPTTFPDNDNRAIHYAADGVPLRGGWLSMILARIVTMAFGILLIISVYGLARQTLPDQKPTALYAAFLVATIPQVLFISGIVSNDIPVAALASLTLWQLAALMRGGYSPWMALGIGAAFGLAGLTKASGLAVSLPIAIALLWLGLSKKEPWKRVVGSGLLIGVGFLVVAGWWFARSWYLYGSPLGLETHDLTPWAIKDPGAQSEPFFRWTHVYRSFWIFLGWGTILPDRRFYLIFYLFAALALAGLALLLWRRIRTKRFYLDVKTAIFLMLWGGILANALVLEMWMRRVYAPYGRLMFPMIAGLVLFLVVGWWALHPKLPAVPAAITFVAAILVPFLLLKPAYALPQFLSEAEIAEKSSLNWYFAPAGEEPIAKLLSVTPLEEAVDPDALLPVELCWQALTQPDQNYVVLVHVIGPENSLIAQRRTYPGLGRYPTPTWQSGTAWCETIHILVEEHSVPQTLLYKLEVGFYDPEKDERLVVSTETGEPVAAAFTDQVLITGRDADQIISTELEEPVALLGFDTERIWHGGTNYALTLTWAVANPLDQDLQLFVHLRDLETGTTVAQADGPPLGGWYPTSKWLAKMPITDNRSFYLPEDVAPGHYQLVVGFYDLATGQRIGPEFQLETIEVQS